MFWSTLKESTIASLGPTNASMDFPKKYRLGVKPYWISCEYVCALIIVDANPLAIAKTSGVI